MFRGFLVWLLICFACAASHGQDLDGVQVHGFATQGFLYSKNNNWLVSGTNAGNVDWTEAAVSFNARPTDKMRVGIQLHYYELSDLGANGVSVDWAMGEYKMNEHFGVRAGKVKAPLGLFNDSQDIDPVLMWCLLPQGSYQLDNRDFNLSHYGGEVFGSAIAGAREGKITYRLYGGANKLPIVGGFGEQLSDNLGLPFDAPLNVKSVGGDLRWQTPFKPLMLGTSLVYDNTNGTFGSGFGKIVIKSHNPILYGKFETGKWFAAGEFGPVVNHLTINVGPQTILTGYRISPWYLMASYHVTPKLQVGTYYSHYLVHGGLQPVPRDADNSKDLVFSSRFDFNPYFYAKAETHFLHGEAIGYYPDDNPNGLKSRTNLVLAKLGFSF